MAEYIDRETFLKNIEERYCLPCKEAGRDHNGCKCRACWVDDMRGDVIDATADDVAPVVHGRWLCGDYYDIGDVCSECDWDSQMTHPSYRYCPNCGARMDGDDDDKAD